MGKPVSSNGYGVDGAVVTLTPGTGGVRTDQHGVPIHGTLAGYPDWHVTTQLESQLTAELDYAARPDCWRPSRSRTWWSWTSRSRTARSP